MQALPTRSEVDQGIEYIRRACQQRRFRRRMSVILLLLSPGECRCYVARTLRTSIVLSLHVLDERHTFSSTVVALAVAASILLPKCWLVMHAADTLSS